MHERLKFIWKYDKAENDQIRYCIKSNFIDFVGFVRVVFHSGLTKRYSKRMKNIVSFSKIR